MNTNNKLSMGEAEAFVIAMIQSNTEFAKMLAECKTKEEMAQKTAIAFALMANK